MIGFKLQQNERTASLGFATDKKCEVCGCVSSAYLGISPSTESRDNMVICKGCLVEAIELINKGILEQTKERV